ncbi:hypothetical protein [Kribbella solani]|uniref:Uncharacterized protein n=1 Tax=Kribbella solani TaxID=236067 RepID=A0A841DTD3_9ACTN|nr:hypothetical protein [Kribbella solani]MBB5982384.1 hypothetical protein [Kribbella solani]MDX2972972.1 hypothetical protein [Kribbella solani]MDX3006693.1 hypothetical protein [Kribbella solani]
MSREEKLQAAIDAAAQRVVDEINNKKAISQELGRMPGVHDAFKTADKNIARAQKDLGKAVERQQRHQQR